MRYAALKKNDVANGSGICVSFWTQGCPHKCKGCHNPETWNFNGGKEFTPKVLSEIYEALGANGVQRSFSILGGEPMCEQNLLLTYMVLQNVKSHFPKVKVYLWTGYYYEDLLRMSDPKVHLILDMVDILIDGPYDESKKDITLKMRGSSNQSIINLKEKKDGRSKN